MYLNILRFSALLIFFCVSKSRVFAQTITTHSSQAFNFNGGNYIKVDGLSASGTTLPFIWPKSNNEITIEFWINANESETQNGSVFAFGDAKSSSGPHTVGYMDRIQAHVAYREDVNGKTTYSLHWDRGVYSEETLDSMRLTTDFSCYVGKWTHVALVSQGVGGQHFRGIYINGVLVKWDNHAHANAKALYGINMGYFDKKYHQQGLVHDFRVWDVVRSQTEIASNMNATDLMNSEHLVGYWKMNENTNTSTIIDYHSSVNNYNATVIDEGTSDPANAAWGFRTSDVGLTPATIVNLPPTVAISSSPIALTGNPTGGVFSGVGVSGALFYPSSAVVRVLTNYLFRILIGIGLNFYKLPAISSK